MKKIIPIVVLGLILGIVAISGCTSSASKEIVVKEVDISTLSKGSLGGEETIVDIPDNATNVRAVYNLTGKNAYGMGSNGNLGFNSENINPNSGESPISFNNKYLEAGPGEKISGELKGTDHGVFYYSGNFQSGKITIYATVPG